MSPKLLVTYFSQYGSTAEIASQIGVVLREKHKHVDVLPVVDVTDIESYDAIVIGGAIYSGSWSDELLNFVDTHQSVLSSKQIALFVVAMRLRKNSDDMKQSVAETIRKQRIVLKPTSIGLFPGTLDYSKLSPIVRLHLRKKGLPEGDFRDWDAIVDWARKLVLVNGH